MAFNKHHFQNLSIDSLSSLIISFCRMGHYLTNALYGNDNEPGDMCISGTGTTTESKRHSLLTVQCLPCINVTTCRHTMVFGR